MTNSDEKTGFTFHLSYFDGKSANEICTLNFYANPREFGDPNLAVENSWEVVDAFANITKIFQKYMKSITMDYMQKNYQPDIVVKTEFNQEAKFVFKLIHHNASVRQKNKLTDEKEMRLIYEHQISATDFYPVSQLSIIPIWKDFEVNGVQKDGIRSILKDLCLHSKYKCRFTKSKNVLNTFCVNSIEL